MGSRLGEERAGFSGFSKVMVFTHPGAPEWPSIRSCLESAAVDAEMDLFTGVLIHSLEEPDVEAGFRSRGLQVIVRSLSGGFNGGLPVGFSCPELVEFLAKLRVSISPPPQKSPVYAGLLDNPSIVAGLADQVGCGRVGKFVEFFAEFEGEDSPEVAIARETFEASCGFIHFRRGDNNADGSLDISDPIAALGYLFLGFPEATCEDSADSNDDGLLDVSDPVFALNFLFVENIPPPPPFCACGLDPTDDRLTCEVKPACGS